MNSVYQTNLLSPWATEALNDIPFNEYPRPQLKREDWINLNGKWDFSVFVSDKKTKEKKSVFADKIIVPYPPESTLSGVKRQTMPGETLEYFKNFTWDKPLSENRVLLHFGACDQIAEVFLNQRYVGYHIGGYVPFSFDVTDYLKEGENSLLIRVWDDLDQDLPYGKQSLRRGGMWYTPISGIWQTVWMESVPQNYISGLVISSTLHTVNIDVLGGESEKTISYTDNGSPVSITFTGTHISLAPHDPHLWSPDDPFLYSFTVKSGRDTVSSYFAMRTVSVGRDAKNHPRILLNGRPFFFNGLLDQGYYSDGIYVPASSEGYRFDIQTAKSLGFNTLRKHIKLEPDIYYYECDRLGMVVFQDFVNSGKFSFVGDSLLPSIGFKGGKAHWFNAKASQRRKKYYTETALETQKLLFNHPCVCLYTIFNEGWGQHDAEKYYRLFKNNDSSRLYDTASGWFSSVPSDVQSEHIYFRKPTMHIGKKPAILSEFGGFSYREENHIFNLSSNYGYGTYQNKEEAKQALLSLFRNDLCKLQKKGLSGAIYTQLSDVEDETNGLITYDRQVVKFTDND